MPSPIEMLIDKACGYKPGSSRLERLVMLRCPTCKREQRTTRDATDPKQCALIELKCPECFVHGEFESPTYYDANGAEILPCKMKRRKQP